MSMPNKGFQAAPHVDIPKFDPVAIAVIDQELTIRTEGNFLVRVLKPKAKAGWKQG